MSQQSPTDIKPKSLAGNEREVTERETVETVVIDYAKTEKKPVEPVQTRGMPQGFQGDTLAGDCLGVLGKVDSDEKEANDLTQSSSIKADIT